MFYCLLNRIKRRANSCGNLSTKIWQMIMLTRELMHYSMHLKYVSYNAVKGWNATTWRNKMKPMEFKQVCNAYFCPLLLEITCCWSTALLLTPFKYFTFWSAKLIRQHFKCFFQFLTWSWLIWFLALIFLPMTKICFFVPINCHFTNSSKFKGTLLRIHYHLNDLYIFKNHQFATWRNCWNRKVFKNQSKCLIKRCI